MSQLSETQAVISEKTKKHKCLSVMSLAFIKLFFARDFVLTIEEVIEEFRHLDDEFKSQSRRLYDVANVLMSLGVIERVKYKNPDQRVN